MLAQKLAAGGKRFRGEVTTLQHRHIEGVVNDDRAGPEVLQGMERGAPYVADLSLSAPNSTRAIENGETANHTAQVPAWPRRRPSTLRLERLNSTETSL